MIRYIAELAQKSLYPPELAIAASITTDQEGQIISMIDTSRATSSYWIDWGGSYDNPTSTQLQIYFREFLQQVASITVLLETQNSFFVSGDKIYMNTTYFPWQYDAHETETLTLEGYASAVPDPAYPSKDSFTYGATEVRYPVRLKVPSGTMNNKLADIISGIVLYSSFSIELENSDGKFDAAEDINFFNTPARIKKSTANTPTLSDFTIIRYGLVDNIDVTADSLTVKIADINRTLSEQVCRVFTASDYPSASSSVLGKNIPVAYGPVYGRKLYEVATDQYIVCDPDYITSVTAVYDSDGNSLSHSFDSSTGIITVTESDGDGGIVEAETADFTGHTDNRIGEIITREIALKSNIPYRDGPWDKTETDAYIASSSAIGICFDNGDVKKFIKEVLKNDNAFLINKNDGRLTLRQWGGTYDGHAIPSWMFTKKPSRTHIDQKYYASSVTVNYLYNYDTQEYNGTYLNDASELSISEKWRKKQRQTFDTLLLTSSTASSLALRMLNRFKDRREIYTVATGYDCSEINPLDTVTLDMTYNGRTLTSVNTWIVRDVNPAQDTLVLEALSTVVSYDGILSAIGTEDYDGFMCMNGSENNDALLAQPGTVEEN